MKIVIIGAGVAGLSLGWRLAQAGAEVTILERSQPGSGATGAAAGMIAVTAELMDAHAVEIEFARHSNALWPEFAEELEAVQRSHDRLLPQRRPDPGRGRGGVWRGLASGRPSRPWRCWTLPRSAS